MHKTFSQLVALTLMLVIFSSTPASAQDITEGVTYSVTVPDMYGPTYELTDTLKDILPTPPIPNGYTTWDKHETTAVFTTRHYEWQGLHRVHQIKDDTAKQDPFTLDIPSYLFDTLIDISLNTHELSNLKERDDVIRLPDQQGHKTYLRAVADSIKRRHDYQNDIVIYIVLDDATTITLTYIPSTNFRLKMENMVDVTDNDGLNVPLQFINNLPLDDILKASQLFQTQWREYLTDVDNVEE